MTLEMLLAVLAILISGLAALEARKANDIGRLNALLALRSHYLALMGDQARLAETLSNVPSGLQAARQAYADLDGKLREVSREINSHHASLVGPYT